MKTETWLDNGYRRRPCLSEFLLIGQVPNLVHAEVRCQSCCLKTEMAWSDPDKLAEALVRLAEKAGEAFGDVQWKAAFTKAEQIAELNAKLFADGDNGTVTGR